MLLDAFANRRLFADGGRLVENGDSVYVAVPTPIAVLLIDNLNFPVDRVLMLLLVSLRGALAHTRLRSECELKHAVYRWRLPHVRLQPGS